MENPTNNRVTPKQEAVKPDTLMTEKSFRQNPDGSLTPVSMKVHIDGRVSHDLSEEQARTINEEQEDLRY